MPKHHHRGFADVQHYAILTRQCHASSTEACLAQLPGDMYPIEMRVELSVVRVIVEIVILGNIN